MIFLLLQFVQNAQEFLLPKLKQKYVLWFCCDGGLFNKHRPEDENEAKGLASLYDDLNLQEIDQDDPRIKQVMEKFTQVEKFKFFSLPQKPEHSRECQR